MALTPTYSVVNSAGVEQGTVHLLLGAASEAFRLWGEVLAGNANLSVRIEIVSELDPPRAYARWGNGTTVGTGNGGYFLAVGAPAYELMSGQNVPSSAGDADVVITFDADYLRDELFLDATPKTRGETPSDRTDGLSVLLHEIGHALGFTGYWDQSSNSFSDGFNTPFDQRLVLDNGKPTFAGPNARALYGGAVPLTDNNYGHYGNNGADPRTSGDPLTGLMNGVFFYSGFSYAIGDLDLAMLADMGLGTIRNDILDAAGHVSLRGGQGDDAITGSILDNILFGDEGGDEMRGAGGDDELHGGTGDDDLFGGGGADLLFGEAGGDSLNGGAGLDAASYEFEGAGVTASLVTGGTGGAAAGDTYVGVENLTGTDFMDTLRGNGGENLLAGLGGNDKLFGLDRADRLFGGKGKDQLDGGAGADTMTGGIGDDIYFVGSKADSVVEDAGAGADIVNSAVGFTLGPNVERLKLTGSAAAAGSGNGLDNAITGNVAANVLNGSGGGDVLTGNDGGDTLRGGLGADRLVGGKGADRYQFETALGASNVDEIAFFTRGSDRIVLENAVFKGLAAGALAPGALAIGNAATAPGHRIIYNPNGGALSYDPDGSGSQAAIRFAFIDNQPATLSTGDFQVI